MDIAIDPCKMAADAPTRITTTLYDLMVALHDVVAPHEDALVVTIVAGWLRAGRITWLGEAASRRRHWGFHPALEYQEPSPL